MTTWGGSGERITGGGGGGGEGERDSRAEEEDDNGGDGMTRRERRRGGYNPCIFTLRDVDFFVDPSIIGIEMLITCRR